MTSMNGETRELQTEVRTKVNPLQQQPDDCSEEDNLFAPDDDEADIEDGLIGTMCRKVRMLQ